METRSLSVTLRWRRLGKCVALTIGLLIASLLLPAGAAQSAPLAQEFPPARLPYDGSLDLPRLEEGTAAQEAAPTLTAPEYANWSRLTFQSARNGRDWEIYTARGDGSNQVNLSNNGSMDIHPRLNRGATRVVFASDRNGNFEIYAMNADGSGQARLTNSSADDVYPSWSSDGSKIVFQSYRDGQAEIYVMNANGSGQARLTNHGDYDGQPAWSPDGARLAFVRRASGQYRLWVMNADGSNQRQLSNQTLSENPVWSPDGSQIAYDADGNGDGWQEIWLMDAGGGNQRQVRDLGSQMDAWVRSWSPDGRYVAYTNIGWIYHQGQWYWTTAYLEAWDSANPWNYIRLSDSGADWHPDWQSMDLQAPSSSVQPLPAQSPAQFTVRWSGTDAGPAGIASFDVQMKEGVAGAWMDWRMATTAQTASYLGTTGRTFYFRARARDTAGNVEPWPTTYDAATTVESLPPVTSVLRLAAYVRGQQVLVRWGGTDPGDSGIVLYDVQVQDASVGNWNDWLVAVNGTEHMFTGNPGHTYRFRVRGTDRAQNVESWPPGDGDAQTTLYRWAVSGTIRDSNGIPVQGASITTSPAAINPATSDGDGNYMVYVGAEAAAYTANVVKAGYGVLPSTTFPSAEDAQLDPVLPPADNVVRNGNFEAASLPPDWQTGGSTPAVITTRVQHTGAQAAWLSGPDTAFTPPANLTSSPADDAELQMIPDSAGGVHLFWQENNPGSLPTTRYARRAQDGSWVVAPATIPAPSQGGWSGFAVGPDGAAHVVGWESAGYSDDSHVIYAIRPPGGTWSAPVILTAAMSNPHIEGIPRIAVSATNIVHVVWNDHHQYRIYWTMKDATGAWRAEPRDISLSAPRGGPREWLMALDQAGTVHVVWSEGGSLTRYACRPATDGWLPPSDIRDGYETPEALAVGEDGTAHVAWVNGAMVEVLHAQGSCQEAWTIPEPVGTGMYPQLAVDQAGTVHLLWWTSSPRLALQYARHSPGGAWCAPQTLDGAPSYTAPSLAVDDSGTAHVLWTGGISGWEPGTIQLYYTRRMNDPAWSPPRNISGAAQWLARDNDMQALAVEGNGRVHAGWLDGSDGILDVYYASSIPNPTSSDSTLSQTITVPAAATHPGLSFLHRLGGASGASGNVFSATVRAGSNTTTLLSTAADTTGWSHQWFDLQPWAGQNVTLSFTVRQAEGQGQVWAALDEVSVGSTYPDLWIDSTGTSALPNEPVVYTITYGNRGAVAAAGVRIVDALPAGMVFVSADPPPSSTGGQLVWDVGNLLAHSGPFTITVTARADPPVGLGTVTSTASITAQSAELETHNNRAQAMIFVGFLTHMPAVVRR